MSKQLIAFSLWGNNPKYTLGAIENAKLTKTIYPGWTARFYVAKDVELETLKKLLEEGAEVFEVDEPIGWTSTFWRFYPVAEDDVDVLISRDADSRLSLREKEAVDEWMASGKAFHVMRDHPYHATEILAGMWGARKVFFPTFAKLLSETPRAADNKQADQIFLREVYKYAQQSMCVHDPFFTKLPFPSKRTGGDFVGQVIEEDGLPNAEFAAALLANPQSSL